MERLLVLAWGINKAVLGSLLLSRVISKASGLFIAGGQRVDTGIVEKSVIAVSPRVGLGADPEVMVGDELRTMVVA